MFVNRDIRPPLRRWAAARIARGDPGHTGDVLARVHTLDAHGGDAVMAGLLDMCEGLLDDARDTLIDLGEGLLDDARDTLIDLGEGLLDDARDTLIDLGSGWRSGHVRLQALQLLSAREPDHAVALAEQDPSNTVRRRALSLRPTQTESTTVTDQQTLAAAPRTGSACDPAPPSDQLALFG
jgi:hypothetical protein